MFLKEAKRRGKWLKKREKNRWKGKNILYGLNVKIKGKLLFCILNYDKGEWIRRDK